MSSSGDLPDPGIYLTQGSTRTIEGRFCTIEPTGKPSLYIHVQRMEIIFLENKSLNLENTLLKILFKLKQVLESNPKRSDKELLSSSAG